MSKKDAQVKKSEVPDEVVKTITLTLKEDEDQKESRSFENVEVKRTSGDDILIPNGMTPRDAREWIERHEENIRDRDQDVTIFHEVPGYPLDGAHALNAVLTEIYGHVNLSGEDMGFFKIPPMMVGVDVGYEKKDQVPWGVVNPKGLRGSIKIQARSDRPALVLRYVIKRRQEHIASHITELVKQRVREHSIYRGHATLLDLSWMRTTNHRGEVEFDPISHGPKFIDLSNIDRNKLILPQDVNYAIDTSVMVRLQHREDCKHLGVPIKHGVLLAGEPGCGKTLCARVLAKEAAMQGWTVFYLKDARDLPQAVRLTELYQPAMLFVEDIDELLKGKRSFEMNEILNVVDGIDTKNMELITVLTSNNPHKIHPVFLRAGRVDSFIKLGKVDQDTTWRLLRHYAVDTDGNSLLEDNEEYPKALQLLDGLAAAYVAEAVHKATLAAHLQNQKKISPMNLELAAKVVRAHSELAAQPTPMTKKEAKALRKSSNQ